MDQRNRWTTTKSATKRFATGWAIVSATLVLTRTDPSQAQIRVIDQGELRVTRRGTVVAREEFSISQVNSGGRLGLRLTATAYYPPRRTRITVSPQVDIGQDSQPTFAQFGDPRGPQPLIQIWLGPQRITVHRVSQTGETWRESPGAERFLVADDSVQSLYAVPLSFAPGPIRIVAPRTGTQRDYSLTDAGVQSTNVDGTDLELRHIVLTSESDVRHLWYDTVGRLMKVEVPMLGFIAYRVGPPPRSNPSQAFPPPAEMPQPEQQQPKTEHH